MRTPEEMRLWLTDNINRAQGEYDEMWARLREKDHLVEGDDDIRIAHGKGCYLVALKNAHDYLMNVERSWQQKWKDDLLARKK